MNDEKNIPLAADTAQEEAEKSNTNIVPPKGKEVKSRKSRKSWTKDADRQLEHYLLSGWSNDQIAKKMGYSAVTIGNHAAEINKRLDQKYKMVKTNDKPKAAPPAASHPQTPARPEEDNSLLAPGQAMESVLDKLRALTDEYGGVIFSIAAEQSGIEICFRDKAGGSAWRLGLKAEEEENL